jgi:hypothetical protein
MAAPLHARGACTVTSLPPPPLRPPRTVLGRVRFPLGLTLNRSGTHLRDSHLHTAESAERASQSICIPEEGAAVSGCGGVDRRGMISTLCGILYSSIIILFPLLPSSRAPPSQPRSPAGGPPGAFYSLSSRPKAAPVTSVL